MKVTNALISEALKDVRQVKNVTKEIEMQVISEGLTLEHMPHLKHMFVIIRRYFLVI